MGAPYSNTNAWRRLRRQVLLEEPICHWCRKAPSTTADHLIEYDRAPDRALDRTNLVGACRACNSRRGQRYVTEKRNVQKKAQKAPAKPRKATAGTSSAPPVGGGFLEPKGPDPERPLPSSLPVVKTGRKGQIEADYAKVGREAPRLVSPMPADYESPEEQFAALARQLAHVDLFPWQRRLVREMLAEVDGRPVWSSALVMTARQNGKTLMLALLVSWWAIHQAARRGTPQSVIITSSKLQLAMDVFRIVADWLEPLGATCRRGNNSPAITMPDGTRIVPVAATADQHGRTADLIVIDEGWDVDPAVYYGALLPAQRTRKGSLIATWSTAGDDGSALLIQLRNQGMKGIETGDPGRLYFAEWSPPAGVSPEERKWWGWANPSLGHLIDADELEVEASMNWQNFVRTGLNQWVTAVDSWLPLNAWERQTTDLPMPAGGILAVEKAAEESRWVGLRAVKTDDRVQVVVEFVTTSEAVMRRELARVMTDRTVDLLIPPGVDLRLPPEIKRRSRNVGIREIRLWTSQVHAMILAGEVWHDGDAALAEHVNRAVARTIEGSWYIVSSRSPGPTELCRCLIWACADVSRIRQSGRAAFASS